MRLFALALPLLAWPLMAFGQTATPCNQYQSGSAPPAGYGAAWNTQTTARELLVNTTCSGTNVTYTVGSGSQSQYVYKVRYYYSISQSKWVSSTLAGTFAQGSTDWLLGQGSASASALPLVDPFHWVGYVCQWTGAAWKCGCRDAACATNYWQLQAWTDGQGGVGGTTGGTTGSTGTQGIARNYSKDQGIQNHPSVVYYNNFENPTMDPSWDHYPPDKPPIITTNAVGVHSGSRGLNTVSNMWKRWTSGADWKVLHMRYYQKYAVAKTDTNHNGGYIVGCGTACPPGDSGNRTDGTNKFIAIFETSPHRAVHDLNVWPEPGALRFYTYHMDQPGIYGELWSTDFVFQPNRWYAIELMLKVNTIGRADGELHAWVDGKKIFTRTGLRYRTVESLAIDKIGFLSYAGGVYFDDLVVATEYIGPMAP